jgi:hypothetical protein
VKVSVTLEGVTKNELRRVNNENTGLDSSVSGYEQVDGSCENCNESYFEIYD